MSAEVIARDLGLDLYTVNLATVVDKYVGETEKNLERIFAEAGGRQRGAALRRGRRRSSASAARSATPTTATPTSRAPTCCSGMETFDGLAILATNLRANIDEAFTRRLDAIVDFPAPDPTSCGARCGTAAWRRRCRSADDVDLDVLRRRRSSWPAATSARPRPPPPTWPPTAGAPVGMARADRGGRAGVPQARPAGAGARVRSLLRADRLTGSVTFRTESAQTTCGQPNFVPFRTEQCRYARLTRQSLPQREAVSVLPALPIGTKQCHSGG